MGFLRRSTPFSLLVASFALALTLAATACTQTATQSTATPTQPAWKDGTRVFDFDYRKTIELTISKNDAVSGDRWLATAGRSSPTQERWEITAAPDGRQLLDREADGPFLLHLLDTLGTLQLVRKAPQGPLASYGLERPFYQLRWRTTQGLHELELGAKVSENEGTEARFARVPPDSPVLIVDGAALKLLTYLDRFEAFRKRKLLAETEDDFDEIEIRGPGATRFYAQREGDGWVGARREALRADVAAWLKALVHARASRFIDDRAVAEARAARLKDQALSTLVLKPRKGDPVQIRALPLDGALTVWVSSRAPAVFELPQDAARIFQAPR